MQLLPYLRKHTAVTMLKNRVMVKVEPSPGPLM
jgi:hypothetical protein